MLSFRQSHRIRGGGPKGGNGGNGCPAATTPTQADALPPQRPAAAAAEAAAQLVGERSSQGDRQRAAAGQGLSLREWCVKSPQSPHPLPNPVPAV